MSKRSPNLIVRFIAVGSAMTLAAPAMAQAELEGIGILPEGLESVAGDVSSDGTTVVGSCFLGADGLGWQAIRWNAATGLSNIDGASGVCESPEVRRSHSVDVSADGSVVVGTVTAPSACCEFSCCNAGFDWSGHMTVIVDPAPCESPSLGVHAVSDSGGVTAGSFGRSDCKRVAFRRIGGGIQELGSLGESGSFLSDAWGISGDGSTIVGYSVPASGPGKLAVRWVGSSAPEVLGQFHSSPVDIAADASAAGDVIVGSAIAADGVRQAFRWTESDGMVLVGAGEFRGVSADGAVAVGTTAGKAMIWDAENGLRDLKTVLENGYGLDLSGWTRLLTADGISADGTVVAGTGQLPSGLREAWRAVVPRFDADTDGDGLLDFWETDGIDVDGDGIVDLDLPAMGADPLHKDLFVELDMMDGSIDIEQAALWVEEAFFFAPADLVNNPDGGGGVDLFIVIDDQDIASESWADNPFESDDFDLTKALFFGTDAERQHPASEQLLEIKRKIFRYCVYIAGTDGDTWVGTARGVPPNEPSNDFIIAGDNLSNACPDCNEERLQQYVAATLMHELGHCLGLEHGGADRVNYKPNYISVMNYLDQFPWDAHQEWRLDYSRGTMFPLNERELNEQFGFFDAGGDNGQTTFWGKNECVEKDPCFPFAIGDVDRGQISIRNGRWIDFNGDGVFEESACADLNYMGEGYREGDLPTPCQVLLDSPDWAILKYALAAEGAGPGADPPNELTVEDVLLLNATFRAPCPADIDASGEVDFADVLQVLARWSEETGHPADVDGDGIVGFGDVLVLLAAWGECP